MKLNTNSFLKISFLRGFDTKIGKNLKKKKFFK